MFNKLPDDIINIIFSNIIHPYNNFYYILMLVNKININFLLFFKQRMICHICKKKGFYCLNKKKSICKTHCYICRLCNKIIDVYNYSFLNNSCFNCNYLPVEPNPPSILSVIPNSSG